MARQPRRADNNVVTHHSIVDIKIEHQETKINYETQVYRKVLPKVVQQKEEDSEEEEDEGEEKEEDDNKEEEEKSDQECELQDDPKTEKPNESNESDQEGDDKQGEAAGAPVVKKWVVVRTNDVNAIQIDINLSFKE